MTPQEIQAILQAIIDGKTVEFWCDGEEGHWFYNHWLDYVPAKHLLNFGSTAWRIKTEPPQPRSVWIDSEPCVCVNKVMVVYFEEPCPKGNYTEFREVIPTGSLNQEAGCRAGCGCDLD